ncbi:MAG: exo-beta-N-acetylmuramidase NamZ domain-containing protein [Limisphaerales bacterium]
MPSAAHSDNFSNQAAFKTNEPAIINNLSFRRATRGLPNYANPKNIHRTTAVKLGDEVLFEKHLDLIRGKHVGLITNPTGLDSKLDSIIEKFRAQPDVKLVALYGPEHGVRGNAQAGEYVPFYFDEHLKLPVFSLYGQTHKPPADMMTNIDEYMRTFDTKHEGKQVETA